jgi:AcrR family transcriptional regulator
VSHRAPRRYFPARIDLLAALAADGFAVLADRLAAAGTAHLAPGERLARAARTYVEFAHDHRGLFELMFRHDLLVESGHRLREVSLPLLAQWQSWYGAAFPGASAERAP